MFTFWPDYWAARKRVCHSFLGRELCFPVDISTNFFKRARFSRSITSFYLLILNSDAFYLLTKTYRCSPNDSVLLDRTLIRARDGLALIWPSWSLCLWSSFSCSILSKGLCLSLYYTRWSPCLTVCNGNNRVDGDFLITALKVGDLDGRWVPLTTEVKAGVPPTATFGSTPSRFDRGASISNYPLSSTGFDWTVDNMFYLISIKLIVLFYFYIYFLSNFS